MTIYTATPEEDAAFLGWWQQLHSAHELEATLGVAALALSRFYDLLRKPRVVLYEADAEGLYLVMIVSEVMRGAFITLWVAPRKRRSPRVLRELEEAYEVVLAQFPVLCGLTRQESLLHAHARWGYTVGSKIPGIFDGHDAWLVVLTESAYYTAKAQRRRQVVNQEREAPNGRLYR